MCTVECLFSYDKYSKFIKSQTFLASGDEGRLRFRFIADIFYIPSGELRTFYSILEKKRPAILIFSFGEITTLKLSAKQKERLF